MATIDLSTFHGPNAGYALELFELWRTNPELVDADTRAFFEAQGLHDLGSAGVEAVTEVDIHKIVAAAKAARLIRELGHLGANIDPLGLIPRGDPDLEIETHGLTNEDLQLLPASIIGKPLSEGAANAREALDRLREAYSGTAGYEDDQIQVNEERAWLREAVESRRFYRELGAEEKRELLELLTRVEVFEQYLHKTFVGQKRFSIEGCDMLVPMLLEFIEDSTDNSTAELVIGMAHRGRLNVLAHILSKPYSAILAEFHSATREGRSVSGDGTDGWTGDVKYHLGARHAVRSRDHQMKVLLASNPSHLEFVDPVVMGRARAAQESRSNRGAPAQDVKLSGPVFIHGDAAFTGQGIVAETLNLSRLKGYAIGGALHIIVNNQIGFTTEPSDERSTLYASDLAKGFEIPIVHVNADDPEACIAVVKMAYEYIVTFHKHFLIDLVGYRRWGHNEGDAPEFTQPQLYEKIASHPTVRQLWADRLESEGVVSREEAEGLKQRVWQELDDAREHGAQPNPEELSLPLPPDSVHRLQTALPAKNLESLNRELLARPEGFSVNSRLERILRRREQALGQENAIDWGHAEALAFASILADGTPIRLTGQDSERGTFGHRNLVLHDSANGNTYCPLQQLRQANASFAIFNSPLSENAALGFEYGYSMHATDVLVLWEAQFGDFANSAQVMIDQFLVSGNAKWRQTPSLVMLLPHGYEGQGPEHSSARLERFLQLAANDNIRIVNCSSAAQYFHVLRRQAALLKTAPRPLVVMTPKSLLRHPAAASSLRDLTEGGFRPVIEDPQIDPQEATRLVLCSGKVFIDLSETPEYRNRSRIAVARIEQLYPFPADEIRRLLGRFQELREIVWLQEEPKNMGAWRFIATQMWELTEHRVVPHYVGRPESASPAEGSAARHAAEQTRILAEAMANAPQPEIKTSRRQVPTHVH